MERPKFLQEPGHLHGTLGFLCALFQERSRVCLCAAEVGLESLADDGSKLVKDLLDV